jgi:hypothetical protein
VPKAGAEAAPDAAAVELVPKLKPANTLLLAPCPLLPPPAAAARPPVLALLAKPKAGCVAPAAPNAAPPKGWVGVLKAPAEPKRLLLLPGAEPPAACAMLVPNGPACWLLAAAGAAVPARAQQRRTQKDEKSHGTVSYLAETFK